MSKLKISLSVLIASTVVKSFLFHDWASGFEFFGACVFCGFLFWLNPERKQEVRLEVVEDLQSKVAMLQEQLTGLRMKLGFQRSA